MPLIVFFLTLIHFISYFFNATYLFFFLSISGSTTFRPLIIKPNHENLSVADLIFSPGMWNRDLLHQLFSSTDRDRILAIPLSFRQVPDKLIWHHTKDGVYQVKSGYHLASTSIDAATTSDGVLVSLSLPNKVKSFAWRAYQEAFLQL